MTVSDVEGLADGSRSVIVGLDGRAKAYRPLPLAERSAAIVAGLAAYERGDFFLAHEDLEPAWMGTADLAERSVLQGFIKLAAAYVHGVRGNLPGVARNLAGAEADSPRPGRRRPGPRWRARLACPGRDIDLRLAELAADPASPRLGPPVLQRSVR